MYSNSQEVVNLKDTLNEKINDCNKLMGNLTPINDIINNGCSGEFIEKVKLHLNTTLEIINDLKNRIKYSIEQIDINSANCDKVWDSYSCGKSKGIIYDNKIEIKERKKNISNEILINVSITKATDFSYYGSVTKSKTDTKNITISGEDMVKGVTFENNSSI